MRIGSLRRRAVPALIAAAICLAVAPAAAARDQDTRREYMDCLPGISLVCRVGEDAAGIVGHAVGAGVGFAADAVMDGIVGWAAGGAAWLVKAVARQVDRSTRPALGSAWFAARYSAMRQLAIYLSLLFLLLAITHAVARQDMGMLARSCLVALPLALLTTFAAVTLVELALAVTDWLTTAAVSGTGPNLQEAFADVAEVLVPTHGANAGLPSFVVFLGALVTAVLALVVWVELILREAAIYVAVAFLPLTLAAVVWRRTAHWSRRLAEWLAAIIFAKLVIVSSFAIAGSMLAHGRSGSGGLTALLAGCAILLIAAFSPWVLLRLIPFAEHAAASLHRGAVGGAVKTAPGAHVTTLLVHQAILRHFAAPNAPARAWVPAAPGGPASAAPRK